MTQDLPGEVRPSTGLRRRLGFATGDTVGSILSRHRGVGPGFDVLRMLLALMIFAGHAKWLAGGHSWAALFQAAPVAAGGNGAGAIAVQPGWFGVTKPLKMALVPAFFALSGFLVTGSAIRLRRTTTFLANRSLRIFPALVVEVVLSAVVLGPVFTTLPLATYWSSPITWRYFGNMVGHAWLVLPGVFADHVSNAVNINLWTLPSEFHCYVIIAVLMISGIAYRRTLFTALAVAVSLALAIAHGLYGISDGTPLPGHMVVLFFVIGSLFYHWRDHLPVSVPLFLACAIATYAAFWWPATLYLAVLPLVYCTVFFGMIAFPKFRLLTSGDYSYGVYLYGFPITQMLLGLFPALYGQQLLTVLLAFALTCLFAGASWHGIEKHALRLKRRLPEKYFPTTPRARAEVAG